MVDQISLTKKLCYGVGHVLNDLSASMWFSYLIIYFHRIVMFENAASGYMMLLGQIADAVSTVFVGFESDKTEKGFFNYGRRKSWHLIGVISVLVSFPFMFNLCIACENAPQWYLFYYYAPFVVIFQFGWAATQISHLSLIPQLSTCKNERVALNAIRYAFTVASNFLVYGSAYFLLKYHQTDDTDNLNRNDAPKFMYLSIMICVVGLFFQIIFHLGTNEKILLSDEQLHAQSMSQSLTQSRRLVWTDYFKKYQFYLMGLLYMCTRLIVNMTQVYLPMYLTDTLELEKSSIALFPLICYASGFISTFPLRYISKYLGYYVTYFFGTILIVGCSALFWYYDIIYDKTTTSIITAILLGSGSTVILVTSLSLTTDLIGTNTGTGAFVFGAMSFLDKISNGVVVALLQQFSPCQMHSSHCTCSPYYHKIMGFFPASFAAISILALFGLYCCRPRDHLTLVLANQEVREPECDEVEPNYETNSIINTNKYRGYNSINSNRENATG